jgi:hypothetical protein
MLPKNTAVLGWQHPSTMKSLCDCVSGTYHMLATQSTPSVSMRVVHTSGKAPSSGVLPQPLLDAMKQHGICCAMM